MSAAVVLLDALGTLVRMEQPGPRLQAELARLGFDVDLGRANSAFEAEIAYYLEHHLEGRDASSLAELRNRCAAVLREALGLPGLSPTAARDAMLAAIRFDAYSDAAPALGALRGRGTRLVVASNWDYSLAEVLDRVGLGSLLDGVVTSAQIGAAKPDPRLFRAALAAVEAGPEQAVHVGDSVEGDVAGARAAGVRAVLLRRESGRPEPPPGVPTIASLAELASLI